MGRSEGEHVHRLVGPALLLAGPGTGKTHQLAKRIRFLVEERKVDPSSITVITFTAAAAANMRARISDPEKGDLCVPNELQPELICTMHSLGYRILREHMTLVGLRDIPSVVHGESTKSILMGDAAQLSGYSRQDANPTSVCRRQGLCRADRSQKCKICDAYRSILVTCNAIDFDEQIFLACRVLTEHPAVAEDYRARARHLLVDEYQDINAAQFELIRVLARGQENGLFVVGDDDQSIYSWRGGSPKFIRHFKQHFGEKAKVRTLMHSFRCPCKIGEGAFAVVREFDKDRIDKGRFTYATGKGNLIIVHSSPSEEEEAGLIRRIAGKSLPSKEVLILVPNRRYAKVICETLRAKHIPFVGPEPMPGQGLPVIGRFIDWVKNPRDNLALRECIENMLASKASPLPSARARMDFAS